MPSHSINFFSENTPFILKNKKSIRDWILFTIKKENKVIGNINFVFCNDEYLFKLNKSYLKHNTLTDILTFDYTDRDNKLSGDIFISIKRVKENAKSYHVAVCKELHRVIIHGVLHLTGYKDSSKAEKKAMTSKEDYYLSLLPV